jgi:hypothetical protein
MQPMFNTHSPVALLVLLIMAHFVADYPLQGEFLAIQKNPWLPQDKKFAPWYQAMTAHCFIHAGFVFLITSNIWLGLAEFVVHFITDIKKCWGNITYNEDQFLHIACKVVWVIVIMDYTNVKIFN